MSALSLYRNMIKRAYLLPGEDKAITLNLIRNQFKANKNESDQTKVKSLLDDAKSKLDALKVMTPKSKNEFSETGTQTFTIINGKIVEGSAPLKGMRDFVDKRIDSDDLARHQRLLRRQYFMEPPPKKY